MQFTNAGVRENYARRFSSRYPNEELRAARPLLKTPIYHKQRQAGAQSGATFGLEIPLWYASDGTSDVLSWRCSTDFDHVGQETRAVRNSVGLGDISAFAKYQVTGRGAADRLDHIRASKIPHVGRMVLAPMLQHDAKIIGDFSLARLAGDNFSIIGSGIDEPYHIRWFISQTLGVCDLQINPPELNLVGLTFAGPKSRGVLQSCINTDISNEHMRFMAIKKMEVGMATAIVMRVSYTVDLGNEIWLTPP